MTTSARNSPVAVAAFLLTVMLISMVWTASVLHAGGTTTALYSMDARIINSGTTDLDDIQTAFNLSTGTLIEHLFIGAGALNSHVHDGSTDVPFMPASDRIQVEGAVQEASGSYTEYTTEAQSAALNDVPVLSAGPAVDDAMYFGCDNPCRIVTWDVDTAGVGTWTITYEYWDGSKFTALSSVDDRTTGFTTQGKRSASWDMPSDWATRATTGSAVNSYWGRARVSAFTSITTQPFASRVRYENGQWWTWVEDLDLGNQEQYTLFFGGETDFQTSHQTFPGANGIITGDAAGLEMGSAYGVAMDGRLDFGSAASNACILCKTGAVTLNVSGSAGSPVIGTNLTGGGTSSGDLSLTMPDTGEQIVIMASDGSNAATWSTSGGLVSYPVQTIADNANNLTWASNGGVDYFNWVRINTAAPATFSVRNEYTEFLTATHSNTQAFSAGLGLEN